MDGQNAEAKWHKNSTQIRMRDADIGTRQGYVRKFCSIPANKYYIEKLRIINRQNGHLLTRIEKETRHSNYLDSQMDLRSTLQCPSRIK